MFVLTLTTKFRDEWDDNREYCKTTVLGLYRTFTKPLKRARNHRKMFVDRLVLEDALEEANYWDAESCNRPYRVGPIFEDVKYSEIDNDDFRSYMTVTSKFDVTDIAGETEFVYMINEVEMID